MNELDIHIEKVSLSEIQALKAIAEKTFLDTYASQNTEEDMAKYLADHFNLKLLGKEVNSTDSAYYFAKIENEIIGYFKLNYGQAQTELIDESAVEIERIYATKAYHCKGLGKLLFENSVQIAKKRNAPYIWLGVWDKNARAIRFYEKCGFAEFDRHVFMLGNDKQTDLMMKLELNNKV